MKKMEISEFLEKSHIGFSADEPMCLHTTFRIGGPAAFFAEPDSIDKICSLAEFCRKAGVPFHVVGKGSNLLVTDAGIGGVVMHLGKNFSGISSQGGGIISCMAGCDVADVCRYALNSSLTGMEFAYGIPGSIGGFAYMNAGAYGGEAKDIIRSVTYLGSDGMVYTALKDELDMSYRHSMFSGSDDVILSVEIELGTGKYEDIRASMEEIIEKRKAKQPLEMPSAGSTFKRPEGAYAGALIEGCGLKGYSVGGASVSEKHAGFLVNSGNASAADMLALIEFVRTKVRNETGYVLEPEVKIMGE